MNLLSKYWFFFPCELYELLVYYSAIPCLHVTFTGDICVCPLITQLTHKNSLFISTKMECINKSWVKKKGGFFLSNDMVVYWEIVWHLNCVFHLVEWKIRDLGVTVLYCSRVHRCPIAQLTKYQNTNRRSFAVHAFKVEYFLQKAWCIKHYYSTGQQKCASIFSTKKKSALQSE